LNRFSDEGQNLLEEGSVLGAQRIGLLGLLPLGKRGVSIEVMLYVAALTLNEVDGQALAMCPVGVSTEVRRQISERRIEDGQQRPKGILIA
jgi:hypothetical protein